MKKKMLFLCIVALTMLAVSGQGFAYTNPQVSLNFSQNTSNQVFSGNQNIGPLSTNSTYWNSTNDATTGDLSNGTLVDMVDSTGLSTGITAEWTSPSGTGWQGDGTGSDEAKLAVGYLDDDVSGDPNFVLRNIPYETYSVYVLFTASNNGDYTHGVITVNGTAVLGGTSFPAHGRVLDGTGWLECDGTVNGNYVKVTGLTSSTLDVSSTKTGTERATLTGVIVVNTDVIIPAAQRSISHNFQYEASPGGWGYHFYLSNSSNATYGFVDPNGVLPIQQTPAGTWNEGRFLTDTYLAKDSAGSTGSAVAVHSGDGIGNSSWYCNINNYINGSPIALLDPNDPSIAEDAQNKVRVSQAFLRVTAADNTDPNNPVDLPMKPLTAIERVPYGKYTVVTYMNPNHFDSLDEIQIEDQTRFYLSQHGGGAYGVTYLTDPHPDGFKWNVARDLVRGGWLVAPADADETTGQRANVAVFQDLTSPDMVINFDAHGSNSGISAYSLIADVDPDNVVTQVTPGNINKDYGETPASKDSTVLSWNAPAYGADSYNVYIGEYGAGVPSLVESDNTTGSYTPTLDYGKTYVWRVDTVRGGETYTGDYFYFDVEGDPVILVQPHDVSVKEGSDTFFDVDTLVMGPEFGGNFAWYYSPDAANDTPGDDVLLQNGPDAQVDILEVAPADVGYYYVVLTNTIPDSATVVSEVASLEIGQLEIYLPFDGDPNDHSGNDWLVLPGNRVEDANGVYVEPSMGEISYETGWDGVGQAAKFTRGSGDQLEVVGSDDYFNYYPKGFTVRFWYKATHGVGGYVTLISKSSNAWNPPSSGWRMIDRAEYGPFAPNMSPMTVAVRDAAEGEWHMVAVTYDGATQEMKVYQNGYLEGSSTGALGDTTSYPVTIGNQYKDGTGGWGYEGLIDDVEIFSYAVSEYDMLDDYAAKMGLELCLGDIPGDVNKDCKVDLLDIADTSAQWLESTNPGTAPITRVVHWKFDETSGLTATDSSGNGADGALGAGFADDGDAQWLIGGGRTGNTGDNALYFNGDPNTAVIADANAISQPFANGAGDIFEGTASWTMNLWIKFDNTSAMVNIGGFGYNEWPGDPDPDGNSDRYFASYSGGYEFEVGQDGIWPSNAMTTDWRMMTATYDGTTCTIYLDGEQVSQQDVALVNAVEEINLNTARRVLWAGETDTVPLIGTIDDFSIWSEVFNAAQIKGMFENDFPSCDGALAADLNGDCEVDVNDLLIVADDWLECQRVPSSLCD